MSEWTLTLPMLPMSMNEWGHAHWGKRKREADQITNAIGWLAKEQKLPPAQGKRHVTITIHKSLRSRVTDDPSNRDGRSKAILDALKKTGCIKDDSDKWLDWGGVHEGERRAQVATTVLIREVDA